MVKSLAYPRKPFVSARVDRGVFLYDPYPSQSLTKGGLRVAGAGQEENASEGAHRVAGILEGANETCHSKILL